MSRGQRGITGLHHFPCPCRLRTVHCNGWWSGHRLIILNTYLCMGVGRLIALLSWVLALSRPTDWRQGWWRSSTALSLGLRSGGLESKFGRRPGPHDRRVMGWSCLCLGYKRDECFWGTQLGTLIHESPSDLVRLVYSLAL